MPPQLLLPLQKENLLRFKDFYSGKNPLVLATLQNWPSNTQMIYLTGAANSGKTHLAEALAEKFLSENKEVLFLSGKDLPAPHFFYDLPPIDCFILDDMDALLSFSAQYEEALFALYNQIFDRPNTYLLFTASTSIKNLPLHLKDLRSRLQGMLQLYLELPDEQDLELILKKHTERLQISLPQTVLSFLAEQLPKNSHTQIGILKKLVEQSLKDQKKLSLIYTKQFLQEKN